ncbi:DUF5999 family protein [Streptomyces goshikiensis]|uniref:DUF5999 family protein n=1 Tax=Streptomyces goshikiensis TaxID=1942 RepID=UPI0036562EAA
MNPVDHGQAAAVHAIPPAARHWSREAPTTRPAEVQRRSLLSNGIVAFDDGGELLPGGEVIGPFTRGLVTTV